MSQLAWSLLKWMKNCNNSLIKVPQECRGFSTTSTLFAQPPRKKRRLDPAILRVRVERKMVKYQREIDKLEAEPRQLIPIQEYQYTNKEIRDLKARPGRTMADVGIDVGTIRAAERLWNFYRLEQNYLENKSIRRVERAQKRALDTLKQLDESLYIKTITADDLTLIPYISSHIRKETAPNPDYRSPDGYIKNITKEWVM